MGKRSRSWRAPHEANRVAGSGSSLPPGWQGWGELTAGGAAGGPPIRVTNHADVTPTRIRWVPDGSALLYSADGRLWKVGASGGQPGEIRFTAELTLTRPRHAIPPA